MGEADAEARLGEVGDAADPDPLAIEEGAAAGMGREHLVGDRVVEEADHRLAVGDQADRDAPVADAAKEVGGAVDRVDDPEQRPLLAQPAFLAKEGIVGEGRRHALDDQVLGLLVGDRNEILEALPLDGSLPRPRK